MLAIATNFAQDVGCPEPALRHIADAGFSHIHWCHHWNTDFVYSEYEIQQIAEWVRTYVLQVNDLHASEGVEKSWVSPAEYERLAGVALVQNRIEMLAALGGDVLVLHLPAEPDDAEERALFWAQTQKSLRALEDCASRYGVRLALENLATDNYLTIEKVLANYAPEYIGLCYDSGHGNICGDGLAFLRRFRHRLIALHLHDNDGVHDQHNLPFSGTVDWEHLAHLIASSTYTKCVNLAVTMAPSDLDDETTFLGKAFAAGTRFAAMVEQARAVTVP